MGAANILGTRCPMTNLVQLAWRMHDEMAQISAENGINLSVRVSITSGSVNRSCRAQARRLCAPCRLYFVV